MPGILNREADLLSRGNPLYGDWSGRRRSLSLVRKLQLSYVLLATGRGHAPRRGSTSPSVASCAALRFSSPLPDFPHSDQSERSKPNSDSHSTQVAQGTVVGRDLSTAVCSAVAPPITHRPSVSGERGDISPLRMALWVWPIKGRT